ncbi:HD domain-containing phosphohydrolase [Rhodovibrionaceae bacterium A322]
MAQNDPHDSPQSDADFPGGVQGDNQGESLLNWRFLSLFGLLVAAGLVGIFLVLSFVQDEKERELRNWQDRLSLIADSRASAANGWLQQQIKEITGIADNVTLQLLMTEIEFAEGNLAAVEDAEGQMDYISNLLEVTAERLGYQPRPGRQEIKANVERGGSFGIALLGKDGNTLVSTNTFQPTLLSNRISSEPGGELIDLSREDDAITATIAAPIFAIQGNPVAGEEIGYIVARKDVTKILPNLLRQPGISNRALEIILVRRTDGAIEYISGLKDGTPAFTRKLAFNTENLAAAEALKSPGGFHRVTDYAGVEVLSTGRSNPNSPWMLIAKIDADHALGNSESRLNRLMIYLLLGLALGAVVILLVWRHGASQRSARSARLYQEAAEALAYQRDLLRLITDQQPTSIAILDDKGHYHFANAKAAEKAGSSPEDMLGKSIGAVIGPAAAHRILALNEEALAENKPISDLVKLDREGDTPQIIVSDHVPVPATKDLPKAVLMVERDLTVEFSERARREEIMDQLIMTLVSVVDRRDPYSAGHSQHVGELCQCLAEEMDLPQSDIETARISGLLMNIGKILIPEELLTRQGRLSDDDHQVIRESMMAGADLLEGVNFSGPVVDTLKQAYEKLDGSGPLGLEGKQIILTARMLAVANAFIGMVSKRAYRDGLSVDESVEQLLNSVNKSYDRGVVAALVNYLDNKEGRKKWEAD